ncbi:filamentous hemagglutinin N-terminal domain-containing protein [Nostoc sp. B(2019)]|nr:filamentous hemagglutinin N-terminal domain-containing protein [Nostoc sp. B(2019)]
MKAISVCLGLVNSILIAGMLLPTMAQVTSDSTTNTTVNQSGNNFTILNGIEKGNNLFHSFSNFSVPTNGSAIFDLVNTPNITNIFSRVTGGNVSNIDGLIRTINNTNSVNLFLLNPSGIVFGPNAQLNIGGSFIGTTATNIGFQDSSEFGTTNLTAPLLTMSVPIGLQFGANPGAIINRSIVNGVGLQVPSGRSLVLAGGAIALEGGRLRSQGGQIELASVAAAGTLGLIMNGNDLRLSMPSDLQRGDISLSNAARANVSGTPGGRITVNAENLNLSGGSQLRSGISGVGAPESRAGNIEINAANTININESGILNQVLANTVGNAGNIDITTGSLFMTNGSYLVTNTRGKGNAGQVNIQATKTVSVDGVDRFGEPSLILTGVNPGAIGNGGDINITAESLSVTNGAYLASSTLSRGNAGTINLQTKTTTFSGQDANGNSSFVSSAVATGGIGTAGDLNIKTDDLFIVNGAFVSTATLGKGDGGMMNIQATKTVSVDGVDRFGNPSFISTSVNPGAIGNGGELNITAESLSVTNGAYLVSSTLSRGNAGTINLQTKTATFSGQDANGNSSFVSTAVATGGIGTAGDLNIRTDALFVAKGAFLSTATLGQGNGGTMNIYANTASFDGFGATGAATFASSAVNETADGNGGAININANSLSVTNGALLTTITVNPGSAGDINVNANTLEVLNGGQILSTSFGSGKAGTLTFNVSDRIILSGSDPTYSERSKLPGFNDAFSTGAASGLFGNTVDGATGAGGDLQIRTGQLLIQDGASVSVSNQGTGNAGNLLVTADSIRLKNSASLRAESRAGSQGNIILNADNILLRQGSNITTDATGLATGGNITIKSPIILGLENSDISANAVQGRGGNIQITTQGLLGLKFRQQLTPENDITASSQFGVNGTVDINNFGVDPSSGLVELPVNLVDSSQQIATGCSANQGSSFVATGRGGVPQNPNQQVMSDRTWSDMRDISAYRKNGSVTAQMTTSPEVLVQATSWRRNAQGKIELLADKSVVNMQQALTCAAVPKT